MSIKYIPHHNDGSFKAHNIARRFCRGKMIMGTEKRKMREKISLRTEKSQKPILSEKRSEKRLQLGLTTPHPGVQLGTTCLASKGVYMESPAVPCICSLPCKVLSSLFLHSFLNLT